MIKKTQITGSSSKYSTNISFIDILMNIIIAFVIMFIMAFLQINEKSKNQVESKAEVLIIMTWPDYANDDIDLWFKLPGDKVVSFSTKDVAYSHLERDDRGIIGDLIYLPNGKREFIRLNKEVITLRALVPGTYTVNVHFYSIATGTNFDQEGVKVVEPPYNARITLSRINPVYQEVVVTDVVIKTVGDEKTAFSFTITDDLEITNINHNQIQFVTNKKYPLPPDSGEH